MRKFATPMTVVPGATPVIEGEGIMAKHARDKKGRPLWNMPKPIGFHKTTEVDKNGRREKLVPVYRGVSASFARYVRSQIRRQRRQQSALMNARDDAVNFMKGVLNPLGG